MTSEEKLYTLALTQLGYIGPDILLLLVQKTGNGKALYDVRNELDSLMPECSERLKTIIGGDWSDALKAAEKEMTFCDTNSIDILCFGEERYPHRLEDCVDAPVVLYYKGKTDLNCKHVINVVGTRHCTSYGADIVNRFISDLRLPCPDTLIVSGLAYGIDINSHTQALDKGFDTVAVVAHGLDTIYPSSHRNTAVRMIRQGGLLSEYMSGTKIERHNFVRRNRIVAGMSDACLIVESAVRGGGLITARIAQDYGREVFAVPGRLGDKYSEGCNLLIRDSRAALFTSAEDLVTAMGWQCDAELAKAKARGIELSLFQELTDDQRCIADLLKKHGDLQLNQLIVKTGFAIAKVNQLLFEMEMDGIIRPMAGGNYHLIQ